MNWSPFDIKMILHFYACADRFPNENAPIYVERLRSLIDHGLIEYREGIPRTTELGNAFVDLLMNTPIPAVRYVDPRFDKSA